MSSQPAHATKRRTAPDIAARKGGEPIVSLTAYTAPIAKLADAHCDLILVGDSLAMVVHGHETPLPITLELMLAHGSAVVRATERALIVVDLPFGTYEESPEAAFRSAARILKETGAGAVKLEGGQRMAETIRFLVNRGIPVMAHIGLTPQAINVLGGFKVQGRTEAQFAALEADAHAVTEAGAFAVVLEAMPADIAARVTKSIPVPTIGIGAGAGCDGQILVVDDMLGLTPRVPKFVKAFASIGRTIDDAMGQYAAEVKARTFPAEEHTYAARPPSRSAKS
jgi:3-methyl-2-oxobutanoate hydroxymethyltransferase